MTSMGVDDPLGMVVIVHAFGRDVLTYDIARRGITKRQGATSGQLPPFGQNHLRHFNLLRSWHELYGDIDFQDRRDAVLAKPEAVSLIRWNV